MTFEKLKEQDTRLVNTLGLPPAPGASLQLDVNGGDDDNDGFTAPVLYSNK